MTVAEDWPVVADDVPSPFRQRLLDGLAASIGEQGYRETTVADIVRHARTSKRTFYGEYSSKEECFIELLAAGNRELIVKIRDAVDRKPIGKTRSARRSMPGSPISRPVLRSRSAGFANFPRSVAIFASFSAEACRHSPTCSSN